MTWPGCLERSHIEAFSAKSESFSYSASDGLGLYAALRAYLYDLRIHLSEDSAEDTAAAMSFFGLCDVIALCHASMRKAISANELEGLTETHLKRFVQAHGIESTVPKHHLCQHLSRCLRTQKYLLSCFVHERKHKQIKHFADMLQNTGSWFNRKILMETRCTRISQVVFSFFSIILLFFLETRFLIQNFPCRITLSSLHARTSPWTKFKNFKPCPSLRMALSSMVKWQHCQLVKDARKETWCNAALRTEKLLDKW